MILLFTNGARGMAFGIVHYYMMKPIYFFLGWTFFGLGFVGAFVPVLPTTPFMLLALWAFARSSERFHNWLWQHPLFGPPLRDWHQHRVIPLYAKFLSIGFMTASSVYLLRYSTIATWAQAVAVLTMLVVGIYILSKPSKAPVA